jgi:hypothetical protein
MNRNRSCTYQFLVLAMLFVEIKAYEGKLAFKYTRNLLPLLPTLRVTSANEWSHRIRHSTHISFCRTFHAEYISFPPYLF